MLYNRLIFRMCLERCKINYKKDDIGFGKGEKVSIFAAAKNARSSRSIMMD